jgi:DNA polymerase-3 subunit epsilon
MRVLVFDTETTGLPETKIMNPDTLNLWPHIVQFSYVVYDTSLNDIVISQDHIVELIDIIIPEESIKFHGITNKIAKRKGENLGLIFSGFFDQLINADVLVGHNVTFDINMIKIELIRLIYSANVSEREKIIHKYNLHLLTNFKNICCTCSSKESIQLCNIYAINKNGVSYKKFPKLFELHEKLFESVPNNLHNSLIDILVTLRCFMKLKHDIDLYKDCYKFKKMAKLNEIF